MASLKKAFCILILSLISLPSFGQKLISLGDPKGEFKVAGLGYTFSIPGLFPSKVYLKDLPKNLNVIEFEYTYKDSSSKMPFLIQDALKIWEINDLTRQGCKIKELLVYPYYLSIKYAKPRAWTNLDGQPEPAYSSRLWALKGLLLSCTDGKNESRGSGPKKTVGIDVDPHSILLNHLGLMSRTYMEVD